MGRSALTTSVVTCPNFKVTVLPAVGHRGIYTAERVVRWVHAISMVLKRRRGWTPGGNRVPVVLPLGVRILTGFLAFLCGKSARRDAGKDCLLLSVGKPYAEYMKL